MKKLICLFLMLWLPLFMGSAWSMNMRMELQNQLPHVATNTSSANNVSVHADMPMNCHMDMSGKSHQKCESCGMCAIANASASFNTVPNFDLPAVHSSTPPLLQVVFISEDLPPAIKPPILN